MRQPEVRCDFALQHPRPWSSFGSVCIIRFGNGIRTTTRTLEWCSDFLLGAGRLRSHVTLSRTTPTDISSKPIGPILYYEWLVEGNTVTRVGDVKSPDASGTFDKKTLSGTTGDDIDKCTTEDVRSPSRAPSAVRRSNVTLILTISSFARLQAHGVCDGRSFRGHAMCNARPILPKVSPRLWRLVSLGDTLRIFHCPPTVATPIQQVFDLMH
ncbi:hypothetical protein EDB89DRAFT_1964218 [Lactarius sanguifluus]|nr:hypothetical protein EDB89DRAFT_1964218 [Lactarius sanguifluus]